MNKLTADIYWNLFVYDSKSSLPKMIQQWLYQICLRKMVDLKQLYHLRDSGTLPSGWKVQGREMKPRETFLGFSPGYLVIPDEETNAFLTSFKLWIEQNTKRFRSNSAGICNLLLFCSQTGFLHDVAQWELSELVIKQLSDEQLKSAVRAYCNAINQPATKEASGEISLKQWEDLMSRAQYYDAFDRPFTVISMLLHSSRMLRSEMLLQLKPRLRAYTTERMRLPVSKDERNFILDTIRQRTSDSHYFVALLFQCYNEKPEWLDQDAVATILNHDDTYFIYFIEKVYSPRPSHAMTVPLIKSQLDTYILNKLKDVAFVNLLQWPKEWESLAGWLDTRGGDVEIPIEFYQQAFLSFSRHFHNLSMQFFSPDKSLSFVADLIWDIQPAAIQKMFAYIAYGYLKLGSDQRTTALNSLKNSFFRMKEALYTNYVNNNEVLEICDRFLYFYCCASILNDLTEEDIRSLQKLLTTFDNAILYNYARYRRRHQSFWKAGYEPPYCADLALQCLRQFLENNPTHPVLNYLRQRLNASSGVEW